MTQLEALEKIYEREGKILRPKTVVDEARPESSPLHGAFCWDDTEAAEKYRIIQAQQLIRTFKTAFEQKDKEPVVVSTFVSVPEDRTGSSATNGYRHISDVVKAPDLMKQVITEALQLLKDLKQKYEYLSQLKEIWDAIDKCDIENNKNQSHK